MRKKLDIEERIAALEEEFRGIFPNDRKSFEDDMRKSPHEPNRENPALAYLFYLESLKREKDMGSRLWDRMSESPLVF